MLRFLYLPTDNLRYIIHEVCTVLVVVLVVDVVVVVLVVVEVVVVEVEVVVVEVVVVVVVVVVVEVDVVVVVDVDVEVTAQVPLSSPMAAITFALSTRMLLTSSFTVPVVTPLHWINGLE